MYKRIRSFLPPFFIVSIISVAYHLTLAPGLSWANGGMDGGDLITATAINGVPHPTGYPSYLLIAGIFQKIPLGNLAYRTNLLSAVCGVAAALLVYFVGRRLFKDAPYHQISACVASLAFGLSPLIWSQAVITEVYTLQALLTVAILYQTFFPPGGKAANFWRGALLGIALGNHLTSLFLLPLLFWNENIRSIFSPRRLAECAVGLCSGLLIYLILPWRALSFPAVNWNNPTSIGSLYQLVSGQIYQTYFSLDFAVERFRGWIGVLLEQFTLIGVAIGLFGLLDDRQNIKQAFVLIWIFLIHGIFALIYSSSDSYVYLIPTVLVFSLWLGKGFQGLMQALTSHWQRSFVFIYIILVVVLIFRVVFVGEKVDASKDERAENFGRQVLSVAPMNGIIVASGDGAIFALWYFHFALHQRPDLTVISMDLLAFDWYRENLHILYPSLVLPESSINYTDLRTANPSQPVCYVEWNEHTQITCQKSLRIGLHSKTNKTSYRMRGFPHGRSDRSAS